MKFFFPEPTFVGNPVGLCVVYIFFLIKILIWTLDGAGLRKNGNFLEFKQLQI